MFKALFRTVISPQPIRICNYTPGTMQANRRYCTNANQRITIGQHNINYRKVGEGSHTVLLLPGALGSIDTDFGPQLSGLDLSKFTLYAWDPPGYGHSRPPDRTWPLHFLERDACVATELMQELGIQMYSLLGWSDGGITAMIMAARKPEAVEKLVMFGGNAYVTDADMKIFQGIRNIDEWSPRMRESFLKVYDEKYFREQWAAWVDAYQSYLDLRDGDICKDDLDKITCPTLIIHGQKDAMVPQFHPDYLKHHIRGASLYNIPDGKHNLHFKYAAEFNRVVTRFLLYDEVPASHL